MPFILCSIRYVPYRVLSQTVHTPVIQQVEVIVTSRWYLLSKDLIDLINSTYYAVIAMGVVSQMRALAHLSNQLPVSNP